VEPPQPRLRPLCAPATWIRRCAPAAEAVSLTKGLDDSPVVAWAGAAHAGRCWRRATPNAPYDLFVESCGGAELPRVPAAWRAIWLERVTDCLLRLGRPDEARRVAELCERLAGAYTLPLARAITHRAIAAVALEAGDAATAAERALASAAAPARSAPASRPRCRARSPAARWRSSVRTTAPRPSSSRAMAEVEACGSTRRRDQMERELRKLGRAVYRRSRPGRADEKGVASLTGRELELARLVVDRRTNQEIAAELFLSIKTVETHMRNIFRKLDAGSRVEVARIVERAEAR
jgi:DNA-binding CsgD family transcriptional regulator